MFDELLAEMREAVTSRNALYEAAMDYPSATLCLSEVLAVHNAKHSERPVPGLVSDGDDMLQEEKEVVYG